MTGRDAAGEGSRAQRLRQLTALFLRLGTTAFGGPAAHIAMMEDEVVRRRRWLSRAEFLDLLGATNLIPGPNSTEMAIHVGLRRAGWAGLALAGACFIAPAFLIVLAFAWGYVRYGELPAVEGILYGVQPVVIAVVLQALWRLGRSAIRSASTAVLAAGAVAVYIAGVDELAVLFGAGAIAVLARGVSGWRARSIASPLALGAGREAGLAAGAAPLAATAAGAAAAAPFGLLPLFWIFLKIGSVLFGSGYVLLAFLRSDLVEERGWLSEAQLIDAVAVGQVTPGPVFTTATFVGYLLGGFPGAAVATAGIFLPAFVFVAASGPLIPRIRRSPLASAALDGVNAASLALMAVVTFHLAASAVVDAWTAALAVLAAVLLLRWKLNSAWLILGGAVLGYALATAGMAGP